MILANIWFIRQTRREAAADVSIWFILTHPALRLVLCKSAVTPHMTHDLINEKQYTDLRLLFSLM